jgi:hypothetical protein
MKHHITTADIKIELMGWEHAKAHAAPIREQVFINEQQVPEQDEWDQEDATSTHLIVFNDKQAIATARLTQAGKIGRMAVLKAFRQQGIGTQMLIRLINEAKQQEFKHIVLWSQTHALSFYQKQGFEAYGDEFLDAGIPHLKMRLNLD